MTSFCVLRRLQCYYSLRIDSKHFVLPFQNYSIQKEKKTIENDIEKQNKHRLRDFKSCHINDSKVAGCDLSSLYIFYIP